MSTYYDIFYYYHIYHNDFAVFKPNRKPEMTM